MNTAPLGVYVHWPFCARICPYCDFNVVRDRGETGRREALVRAILDDLRVHADLIGPRRLGSIFFGGGTPSLMDPRAVDEIIATAGALWPPEEALEVTLEANPTDAEADRFAAFAAAGVNRLSLGVQALDDEALRALGRNHDAAQARRAAERAARYFRRLSIDMIYARPGQSPEAWAAELRECVALGPEHVSPYQLTIESGTAFERAVRRGTLDPPGEDLAADLYEATQDVLAAAGFTAYEISNHARGEAGRSRHNLVYWRGQDYLGVGPGAHGRITVDGQRWATAAARSIDAYREQVEMRRTPAREALSERDVALERLLMGLRTLEGVALADLAPLEVDSAAVSALGDLVAVSDGRLIATAAGRPVLDRVVATLAHGA